MGTSTLQKIKYIQWDVVAMYVSIAVIFTFEMMGVFGSRYITITHIIREHVPLWARGMIVGWLIVHFLIQS